MLQLAAYDCTACVLDDKMASTVIDQKLAVTSAINFRDILFNFGLWRHGGKPV